MLRFAGQTFLEVWYAHLDIEQAIGELRSQMKAKRFKAAEKLLAKAHTADSTKALGKLMRRGRAAVPAGQGTRYKDRTLVPPIQPVTRNMEGPRHG